MSHCCTNCFESPYIKDVFPNNGIVGDCDYCSTKSALLCEPSHLLRFFSGIFDLYIPDNNHGNTIEIQIEKDFPKKIFSFGVKSKVAELITAITIEDQERFSFLLSDKVSLRCNSSPTEELTTLQVTWENLTREIKSTNRFHLTNKIDLSKLERLLKRHSKTIESGKNEIFYRGRISNASGFPPTHMANPPADKAKPGRANPSGISYLYLANDLITTLFETRATLHDYLSIGEFQLKENLNIVALRDADLYDPMPLADQEWLEDFIIHLPFISRLSFELAKPIRRSDNDLDYLPTQYLCEFIKSIGFDGVEYKSSLNPQGYNLAVFHPSKLECIGSYVHEIHKMDFDHKRIS